MLPTWIFEAKARHDALLEQEVGRVAFFVFLTQKRRRIGDSVRIEHRLAKNNEVSKSSFTLCCRVSVVFGSLCLNATSTGHE